MALDTFIAGRYSCTYNSTDVGITEAGYTLTQMNKAEEIRGSDAYGDALLDAIVRGGDVELEYKCKAYKAGSTAPFWPFGSLGVMATTAAPIGRLYSAIAASTVLTAASNTPAAAAPATLTGTLSILHPTFQGQLLFDSKLRTVPIKLVFLPSESTGTVRWFTTT